MSRQLVLILGFTVLSHLQATDLAVLKEGTKRSLPVGETMTFTLTADNTSSTGGGPLDSPNTQVVDTLPPTMRVISTTTLASSPLLSLSAATLK